MGKKLYEALTEGQRVGRLGLGAGLNPYQAGTAEHSEWMRGWNSGTVAQLERTTFAARMVA